MNKILLVFACAALAAVESNDIKSNFYREESCAQKNGFCLMENECPTKISAELKNACSAQQSQGAVCCPNFPQSKVNCHQLHNECKEECPDNLTLRNKGCEEGTFCCVLTN